MHTQIIISGAREGLNIRNNNEAFVDDTDGYSVAQERGYVAESEVIKSLQRKSQLWAKLIAILGEAIAFHKFICQIIGWNYSKSPPEMKKTIQTQDRIDGQWMVENIHKEAAN